MSIPTSQTRYFSFLKFTTAAMDTAIDLSDASKALDLANIRFQLM
jgi:hypothetical protein